ncbi:SDR family NAD(P)-dependent oxidoreductase [Allokutzneria albata]|uniref:NAD(P)-dependent dehydrogenase, short-chain alcohol dehydrogenase family n=1 Tax=Allokutzneria albata TaxID=211114 RepID=A0A1G9U3F3_ALLAB|nr:SDR family oxidoreductase [Allokutzneria albata]SDM54363.1 NAD(P)-dependent dehydrogenase, short-chain alcohol dehydrogenase family [Allokutzneria albata]
MTRIALITGGSRGLGRNTALHLARQGVDLVITYRTAAAEAEAVVAEARQLGRTAVALPLDAGDSGTFAAFTGAVRDELAHRWGRDTFDFLVNNAGIGRNAPFGEVTEDVFDELMNVHLKGVFFLTQALLPLLADGGRIVNLSTGLTRFTLNGYSAYASMKGAVEVLTRYLAKELGPRGIAVNTVAPGPVETDFSGGVVRDNAELNSFLAAQTALGRTGQPDDIGASIAALLTDGTGWITAQRIEISGGTFL